MSASDLSSGSQLTATQAVKKVVHQDFEKLEQEDFCFKLIEVIASYTSGIQTQAGQRLATMLLIHVALRALPSNAANTKGVLEMIKEYL